MTKLQVFLWKVTLLWDCLVSGEMKPCNTEVEQACNKLQLLFSLTLGQVLWCTSWHRTDADGSRTKKMGRQENAKLWKWRCRVRRLKARLTCSWLSLQIPKASYWCQGLERANIIISQHKREVRMSLPGTSLVKVEGLVQMLKNIPDFLLTHFYT